ncbi:unnamed protein product [Thelazia callipaeda]|uniref:ADAMTS_CR_3 domain-containing protein n=1 Tax=Thelazia callipaeda TaxID=103827 RepID=A0A0N5CZA5_THECL|nr:unnamed protein product [Thelazia callipaeda]
MSNTWKLIIYGIDEEFNLKTTLPQGWAKWSDWGSCSASCGGGISSQMRRCLDVRCAGVNHRERICNMEQCMKAPVHARETYCSKLNNLLSASNNLQSERWIPIESTRQLSKRYQILNNFKCIAMCRSLETGEEKELKKLPDGTSCFIEGYNMSVCISGICRHVGCDGIIGSNSRTDHCGICGGTGESCTRTIFQWKDTKQFSPCDATCGPNAHRVSVSVCQNMRNKRVVPERLCADQPRPRPVVEKCPDIVCPSK